MKLLVFISLLLVLAVADKYAVIMATADGWGNYSITSNPCRAYTDFVKMGIPEENIIFMTYHKNLEKSKNPYKGMIFTDPADNTDGDWAQYGCFDHIDYTDDDINVSTFLSILSGDIDKVAAETNIKNPKVLRSGPEDTLLMYIMDHGDYGFYYVDGKEVNRNLWNTATTKLWENKKYKEALVFMEACYGGSMWANYPQNRNMIILTSADEIHSANMSNCPPDDYIGEKHLGTCLSGLFDNSYLTYLEENPDSTIQEVFDAVHNECAKTSEQEVSLWGDYEMGKKKVSDFFGESYAIKRSAQKKSSRSSVPVPEVPIHLAKWAAIRAEKEEVENAMEEYKDLIYARAKEEVELMRLAVMLKSEKNADELMNATNSNSYSASCVESLTYQLIHECGHTATFTTKTVNLLRGLCDSNKTLPSIQWKDVCM